MTVWERSREFNQLWYLFTSVNVKSINAILSIWDAKISEMSEKFVLPFFSLAACFVGIRVNDKCLHSFGQDVECCTACLAGAGVQLSEAETVDFIAAAVLCGTETVGIPATFCGLETAGVLSSWSDMIPSPKYNVHANRLDQCLSNTTFNDQQPWWSEQKQQQRVLWKTT